MTGTLHLGAAYLWTGAYRQAEELLLKVLQLLEGDRSRERFGQSAFPAVNVRSHFARRRAKQVEVADQRELDFTRPTTPAKPARTPTDIEPAARLAIARRAQRAGTGDKVRLALTIFLTRDKAERLSTRAIREQKNLEAVVAEILEAAE